MKASVILYKFKTLSNGEHPLMVVLRDKTRMKRVSLGTSLPKERWNFKKHAFKPYPILEGMTEQQISDVNTKNADIIKLIKDTEAEYADKIQNLMIRKKKVSLDTLAEKEKPVTENYTVLAYFKKIYEANKNQGKIGNYRIYRQTHNVLKDFLKGKDIDFAELDTKLLKDFERHLLKGHDDQTKRAGTVSVYMRTIRALYNQAISEGLARITDYPFSQHIKDNKYKLPKGNNNKRALESSEIAMLLSKNIDSDYYRYLLFTYYALGINFIDLALLKWTNVSEDNNLTYTRKKLEHHGGTIGKLEIPLNEKALAILRYYKPLTGIDKTNYIFPILNKHEHITPAQQDNRIRKILKVFNEMLKYYGEYAGIGSPITTYVLRHSVFTELIRKGLHVNIVKALAGHEKISTTMLYVKAAGMDEKKTAVNML
jgi:site-specific recombinase XerD